MKKHLLSTLFLMSAVSAFAQTGAELDSLWERCRIIGHNVEAPYYFCECELQSVPFAFPMDTVIADTTWFTASMNDLRQGMSAYWFANCKVTMEVYAFCTSKEPTMSFTIWGNQMREVDLDEINSRLAEMGSTAQQLAGSLIPHIRVYPHDGGSGRVYANPYDEGPVSTCEDPLPLRPRMTYVCDKEESVYRMDYSLLPSNGKAFIHWLQKKNKAGEIWLTLDSCTGEEIGRATVWDSLHVFQPDSAQLVNARKAKRSLWMHVKHAPDIVGRVRWYNSPKYVEEVENITGKVCLGKSLTANLRSYKTDTAFTDTVWVAVDTLRLTNVSLTFNQPKLEYDTARVDSFTLKRGYRYSPSGDVFYEYGDYNVSVEKNNTCTRAILLSIMEPENDEAIENLFDERRRNAAKVIKNGQLFILIDDQLYNVFGQQTKNN